jgi:exodeoxyribonuclease V alpha subunit
MEQYLGSGLIKGVGPVTAKRIVAHFGLETLDIIENQSNACWKCQDRDKRVKMIQVLGKSRKPSKR